MDICALASGSSGNCFLVEDKGNIILIDAGISCRQIIEKMQFIGKDPVNIKGIFITHEHSDHTRGSDILSRKFNIPIYATKMTAENCCLCKDSNLINHIKNDETVSAGGMDIEAFSKSHRASDPVCYNIFKKKKISVITDAGYCCDNIINNIIDSDALFLESNYDSDMLENGPYPYFLKKWIKSDIGHLSNLQAAQCVFLHGNPKLKYIILSHLSKNNNTPELALKTFNMLKERRNFSPKILVSERDRVSRVLSV